jgi:hypothetical protein
MTNFLNNFKDLIKYLIISTTLIEVQCALADEMEISLNKYDKNVINVIALNKNDLNYTNNNFANIPKNAMGLKYKLENEQNTYLFEFKQYSQMQPIIQYAKIYFGPLKTYLPIEGDLTLKLNQKSFLILKESDFKISHAHTIKLIYGGQLSNLNIILDDADNSSKVSSYFISPYIRLRAETNFYGSVPIYMEISGYTALNSTGFNNNGSDLLFGRPVYSGKSFLINAALKRQKIKMNYSKNDKLVAFSNYRNSLDLSVIYKFN